MKLIATAQRKSFEQQLAQVRKDISGTKSKLEALDKQEQQLIGAIYAIDNVVAQSDAYDEALKQAAEAEANKAKTDAPAEASVPQTEQEGA